MDVAAYVIFSIVIIALLAIIYVMATRPRRVKIPDIRELEQRLTAVLASEMSVRRVEEILRDVPGNVVQSIIGSTSKRSGKLNELLAALELTKYDRLFYLGSPIDFVGVKYGQGVDFIEVKSGRSRYTDDEKKLRELIDAGMVRYVALKVERIGIAEEIETGE